MASESLNGRQRYLFRGQAQIYPTIQPTLARLALKNHKLAQSALAVCHNANQVGSGFTGYSPRGILDVLALLQHYGWWTPLLDLTGSVEVALLFAQGAQGVRMNPTVYVVDTKFASWHTGNTNSDKPMDRIIVDHDFLLSPLDAGGARARWLRQDGYAITINDWRNLDSVKSFYLLDASYADLVPVAFQWPAINLYDETDAPLPSAVQGILRLLIDQLLVLPDPIRKELVKCTDSIFDGPQHVTIGDVGEVSEHVLKLPRWFAIGFLVSAIRHVINTSQVTTASVWKNNEKPALRAISYAETACVTGKAQPVGFSFADILALGGMIKNLSSIESTDIENAAIDLLRSIDAAAGVGQVYDYNMAAHAGVHYAIDHCIRAMKKLSISGWPVVEMFQATWTMAHQARWDHAAAFNPSILKPLKSDS